MSKTLEQQRAQYALEFIQQEAQRATSDRAKLKTLIPKTPTQIIQNGLGQTLAYLLADAAGNDTPSQRLYTFIQNWLCEEQRPCKVYNGNPSLIKQLMSGDRTQYMRSQEETLTLFNWLKKFADAWL